jgi:hypothetical protein
LRRDLDPHSSHRPVTLPPGLAKLAKISRVRTAREHGAAPRTLALCQ